LDFVYLKSTIPNLTGQDGEEFLALAAKIPVTTQMQSFPSTAANETLE
jgi:propanol-preferring alcohol dehydrogenase